jgi:hypothetical protein
VGALGPPRPLTLSYTQGGGASVGADSASSPAHRVKVTIVRIADEVTASVAQRGQTRTEARSNGHLLSSASTLPSADQMDASAALWMFHLRILDDFSQRSTDPGAGAVYGRTGCPLFCDLRGERPKAWAIPMPRMPRVLQSRETSCRANWRRTVLPSLWPRTIPQLEGSAYARARLLARIRGVHAMLAFQVINRGRGVQVCCDERGAATLVEGAGRKRPLGLKKTPSVRRSSPGSETEGVSW